MKKVVSILLFVCFVVVGKLLADATMVPQYHNGYKTAAAATVQNYQMVAPGTFTMPTPQDLSLGLENKDGSISTETTAVVDNSELVDSLKERIAYLEKKEQVTKVVRIRDPMPKSDSKSNDYTNCMLMVQNTEDGAVNIPVIVGIQRDIGD